MAREGLSEYWRCYRVNVVASLAGWAALTAVLIVVGVAVVHSAPVNQFDHRVTTTVVAHRSPALDTLMKVMTWLGSWIALLVTACLLVVLAARKRLSWPLVLLAVVAWGGEAGGVALAKHVVQRQRPPERYWLVSAHGWSWPSGHTATAVLLFTVLAALVTYIGHPGAMRAVAWVTAALAMGLVAFSRIELGVHWSTDVIAAALFVAGWLAVLGFAFGRRGARLASRADSENRPADRRPAPSGGGLQSPEGAPYAEWPRRNRFEPTA
jgi:membrane-associated phospholipid phosphatase